MERCFKYFIAIIFVFNFIECNAQVPPPMLQPFNLDFEQVGKEETPAGWYVPKYAVDLGFTARRSDLKPVQGKFCMELQNLKREIEEGKYGAVMQSIDAKPWRGKKIRLRAAVRMEEISDEATVHLWMRERFEGGETGLFEFMEDDPIISSEWEYYEISGVIDERTEKINFGLLMFGTGTAWIDDGSIEIIEENDFDYEGPAELSDNSAANIAAFIKLAGYARYYYPGFEALSIDWNDFYMSGVKYVENTKNDMELADKLNKLFKPVAPGMDILSMRRKVDKKKNLKPDSALDYVCLARLYKGLKSVTENKQMPFNMFETTRPRHGVLRQFINAKNLAGKSITIKYACKADLVKPAGDARLFAAVEIEGQKQDIIFATERFTVKDDSWKVYEIDVDIPKNARLLKIMPALIGDGKAYYDDIVMFEKVNGKSNQIYEINNPGFEIGDRRFTVMGWKLDKESIGAGYSLSIIEKDAFSGSRCIMISSDSTTMIHFPEIGEVLTGTLFEKVKFRMPRTVFADSVRTLPYPPKGFDYIMSGKPIDFVMSDKDRTSRFAIIANAWNIARNFNLYEKDNAIWDEILVKCLKKTAMDKSEEDFLNTLKIISAAMNDGVSRVWKGSDQKRYGLPFFVKWTVGKLIITEVSPKAENLNPGDEIIGINGMSALQYFEEKERLISGATKGWKDARAIAEFRIGEKDSEIELEIKPFKGKAYKKIFYRNLLLSELVEYRPPAISLFKNKDVSDSAMTGWIYLDLTRLTDEELKSYIGTMSESDGIIFDLRGTIHTSEHFLGFFTKDSLPGFRWDLPIFTNPSGKIEANNTIKSKIRPKEPFIDKKIIFLSDEKSIGYSEAILSIVKDNRLGEILGVASAGSAGEAFPVILPDGYFMSMSYINAVKLNGESIHGIGVEPTIKVEDKDYFPNVTYDYLVDKAIEILKTESVKTEKQQ